MRCRNVIWMRGRGEFRIVVRKVVKVCGDVGCGYGEGDVEAVGSFVEGVVVVVVRVLS